MAGHRKRRNRSAEPLFGCGERNKQMQIKQQKKTPEPKPEPTQTPLTTKTPAQAREILLAGHDPFFLGRRKTHPRSRSFVPESGWVVCFRLVFVCVRSYGFLMKVNKIYNSPSPYLPSHRTPPPDGCGIRFLFWKNWFTFRKWPGLGAGCDRMGAVPMRLACCFSSASSSLIEVQVLKFHSSPGGWYSTRAAGTYPGEAQV